MLCVCWCFYVFFFFLLLLLLLFPVGITMYVMWILWVLKHKTSVYTMSIFVSIHIWCVWKCCRFFFFFLFCYTLFWRIRDNKNAIFLCSEHFSSVIFEVQKIFAFKKKKKKEFDILFFVKEDFGLRKRCWENELMQLIFLLCDKMCFFFSSPISINSL